MIAYADIPAAALFIRRMPGEVCSQPRLCDCPLSGDGRLGNPNDLRHFLNGQATEIPQFDDPFLPVIELRQSLERFVQREDINRPGSDDGLIADQCDALELAPAFVRAPGSRMVHQNPSHQRRGDPEKMCTIAPLHLSLIDKAHVRFMDKSRRLQRVTGRFTTQTCSGDATQIGIQDRDKLIDRILSTLSQRDKELCNMPGIRHRIGHLPLRT
jgi:hypothetical protein